MNNGLVGPLINAVPIIERSTSGTIDNKGVLVDFTPSLNILTSMIAGGAIDSDGADISSLSLFPYSDNQQNQITKGSEGSIYDQIKMETSLNKAKAEGTYRYNWGITKVAPVVGYSNSKVLSESEINKVFQQAEELSYRATATIEGFNYLSPQDFIKITVIPSDKNGNPYHHHTSGIYFILSIEDTISNGKFVSKLELIKNISSMGKTAIVSKAINEVENEFDYVRLNTTQPAISGLGDEELFNMAAMELGYTEEDIEKAKKASLGPILAEDPRYKDVFEQIANRSQELKYRSSAEVEKIYSNYRGEVQKKEAEEQQRWNEAMKSIRKSTNIFD